MKLTKLTTQKLVEVIEFDNDYHTVTDSWLISKSEYEKRKSSGEFKDWSGYSYFVKD